MVKIFRSSYQFSGNVYVVHSEKGTILIDSGYYDSGIKKYLMEIGGLDAILLTHGHWDHIYALDSLKADFPETSVYIFEDDIDFLTNSHLNCSETNGFRLILQSEAKSITEGDLDIGAYHIQVIHTPGGTPKAPLCITSPLKICCLQGIPFWKILQVPHLGLPEAIRT